MSSTDLIETVLESLDLGEMRMSGDNVLYRCPFHKSREAFSFTVSLTAPNNPYYCYNPKCGATGTITELVMHQLELDLSEAVSHILDIDQNFGKVKLKKRKRLSYKNRNREKRAKRYEEQELYIYKDCKHPYMRDRGFNLKTVLAEGLLYSEKDRRVITPIRDINGYLVGAQGRTVDPVGKRNPKTYNYLKFKKSHCLLGIDKIDSKQPYVILVEGPMDWLKCVQAGYRNTVCCLGSKLSKRQVEILKKLSIFKYYIWFDPDEAGYAGRYDATEQLKYLGTVYWVDLPNKKDIGDLNSIRLTRLKARSYPYWKKKRKVNHG